MLREDMESVDNLIARLKEEEDFQTQDKDQIQGEFQARIELEGLQKAALEAWIRERPSSERSEGTFTYRANLQAGPAFPKIEEYATLIEKSPAYQKLLADVRNECLLAPATRSMVDNIRGKIYAAIRTPETIRIKVPPSAVQMLFIVEWNPIHFVQEQCYQGAPESAIRDAITLTGTASIAQAATCAQYLQQTWPVIGLEILNLVQEFARDRETEAASRRCWVYLSCSSTVY